MLPAKKFTTFDLIILLFIQSINQNIYSHVKNILLFHIKYKSLNSDIICDIERKFPTVINEIANTLTEILNNFVLEKQNDIHDFAKVAYSNLFGNCPLFQKRILQDLVKLTFEKSRKNLAVEILTTIHQDHGEKLKSYSALLAASLDHLEDMSLAQTRAIMRLLCTITLTAPDLTYYSDLQNPIDSMIRKQLVSGFLYVQKQGIIGSVQLIDSIIRSKIIIPVNSKLSAPCKSISSLPDGRSKIGANYFIRAHSVAAQTPELLSLFYDELIIAFDDKSRCTNEEKLVVDQQFLTWCCELITFYFQSNFVVDHEPSPISGVELEYQNCINYVSESMSNSEQDALNIGINIAELVLKSQEKAQSSPSVFAPMFGLMKTLHNLRYDGSLELINALLGCAIILPKFFVDDVHLFKNSDKVTQKNVLDIYFYTADWLRVVVCAFATQSDSSTRRKVLQRLTYLVSVEELIKSMLLSAPADYIPPLCRHLNTVHSNIKDVNSKNRKDECENTVDNLAAPVKTTTCEYYGPNEIYRALDTNILILLQEKLVLKHHLEPKHAEFNISLKELCFILIDLRSKISKLAENSQETNYAVYFISDVSEILRHLNTHFQLIYEAITHQLNQAGFMYSNRDLYGEEFSCLKTCFHLCLGIFASYFAWPPFDKAQHAEILIKSLKYLLPRDPVDDEPSALASLVSQLFDYFISMENYIVDLSTAYCLQQLLRALQNLTKSDQSPHKDHETTKKICNLCRNFLLRPWFKQDGELDRGAQCNNYLDEFVKFFLMHSTLDQQKDVFQLIRNEYSAIKVKDGSLNSLPHFKKTNFSILFRGMCYILTKYFGEKIMVDKGVEDGDYEERFYMWEQSCHMLGILLEIAKGLNQMRIFQIFLKYCHLFFKLMLQHGLHILEYYLTKEPNRVGSLLKDLQNLTRFLHKLSCQSRFTQSAVIVKQIPFLRQTMENWTFSIKALVAGKSCHSVYWMGNLANKDLDGSAIPTLSGHLSDMYELENSENEMLEDDEKINSVIEM